MYYEFSNEETTQILVHLVSQCRWNVLHSTYAQTFGAADIIECTKPVAVDFSNVQNRTATLAAPPCVDLRRYFALGPVPGKQLEHQQRWARDSRALLKYKVV